jgi:hypothetical protein
MTLTLAVLVGVGAELCARATDRPPVGRMAAGTLWIVPTGATIVLVMLLASGGPRLAIGTPFLAAVVVGALCLQAIETAAINPALSWTRPLNVGLAFAVAFAAFTFLPALDPVAAAAAYGLVAVLVAVVVLRGCRSGGRQIALYIAIAATFLTELGLVLHDARHPLVAAGIPLLGLYAVTATAQAILDRAPRRAYLEVALVTGLALACTAFALNHR